MLFTVALLLLVLWVVAIVTTYTISGLVHILPVVALVLLVRRVLTPRQRA